MVGPFALAKNFRVPNNRKMIETYTIKYHHIHKEQGMDVWVTKLPKTNLVKQCLAQGVERANFHQWRFKESNSKIKRSASKVTKKINSKKAKTTTLFFYYKGESRKQSNPVLYQQRMVFFFNF